MAESTIKHFQANYKCHYFHKYLCATAIVYIFVFNQVALYLFSSSSIIFHWDTIIVLFIF